MDRRPLCSIIERHEAKSNEQGREEEEEEEAEERERGRKDKCRLQNDVGRAQLTSHLVSVFI